MRRKSGMAMGVSRNEPNTQIAQPEINADTNYMNPCYKKL